jgi:thiol-disulfide isomerase/thioredoxin
MMTLRSIAASLLLVSGPLVSSAWAQSLAGEWDATVKANGVDVPCRFKITGDGPNIQGTFFNGEELYPSSSGSFANGSLALNYDYTAGKLEATWKDGHLEGAFHAGRGNYPFSAVMHTANGAAAPTPSAKAPSIDGDWEIANNSPKGEKAWWFVVRQNGAQVSAAILRIDGDTGTLAGGWHDATSGGPGKFVLSHFALARAALLEVTPQPDGSLHLLMNGTTQYTALRPEVARAKGLAPPTDPAQHTGVKDASEPFRFTFKDLNGKTVSQDDPRFKNKVIVVNILGSWCPNCHDEAPFLEETYKKYRAKGVEIVALDFEQGDEVQDPVRMRAFVKRYGIDYTVLQAGATTEINDRLPQLKNFNAWPTTFFLGKDGRVAHVHAGFPSSGSGKKYTEAKQDFTETVERLLAVGSNSQQ